MEEFAYLREHPVVPTEYVWQEGDPIYADRLVHHTDTYHHDPSTIDVIGTEAAKGGVSLLGSAIKRIDPGATAGVDVDVWQINRMLDDQPEAKGYDTFVDHVIHTADVVGYTAPTLVPTTIPSIPTPNPYNT